MFISIEVPVYRGRFLDACIDSVLKQSSSNWNLSLLWDGGDKESRNILETLSVKNNPQVQIYFEENRGIAQARKFLTENSSGEYILALDDDDCLSETIVERFLEVAKERPWASLIRARRDFIDAEGILVPEDPWFPFGQRSYQCGMVCDLHNQAQPYLIRRSAYEQTYGWRGFSEYKGAGEDCDIYLQLEEVAHFEFIDEVLYHYRLHNGRTSKELTSAAAFEMWRRLADQSIKRIGLALKRLNDTPPFIYEDIPCDPLSLEDVDFVLEGSGGRSLTALRMLGVPADAIHLTAGEKESCWRMAGFRASSRRLVCFLDEEAEIEKLSNMARLVQKINNSSADLAIIEPLVDQELSISSVSLDRKTNFSSVLGERQKLSSLVGFTSICCLVRREVIFATGGFDELYVSPSLQYADLCIQALRRGFSYIKFPEENLICRAFGNVTKKEKELRALWSKWGSYPFLLEE